MIRAKPQPISAVILKRVSEADNFQILCRVVHAGSDDASKYDIMNDVDARGVVHRLWKDCPKNDYLLMPRLNPSSATDLRFATFQATNGKGKRLTGQRILTICAGASKYILALAHPVS